MSEDVEYIWNERRRALLLEACELWRGTPHRDKIAIPGKGVDCINLVRVCFNAADVFDGRKLGNYSVTLGTWAESMVMKETVKKALYVEEFGIDTPRFGDIVIFKNGDQGSAHCGFYVDGQVWHCLAQRCVTVSPWKHWRHKTHCLLRLYKTGYRVDPMTVTQ